MGFLGLFIMKDHSTAKLSKEKKKSQKHGNKKVRSLLFKNRVFHNAALDDNIVIFIALRNAKGKIHILILNGHIKSKLRLMPC